MACLGTLAPALVARINVGDAAQGDIDGADWSTGAAQLFLNTERLAGEPGQVQLACVPDVGGLAAPGEGQPEDEGVALVVVDPADGSASEGGPATRGPGTIKVTAPR